MKALDGGAGVLLNGVLLGAALAGGDHIGLQQGALEIDVVVVQSLVHEAENLLGDTLSGVEIVITIRKNLRLHNWHKTVLKKDDN